MATARRAERSYKLLHDEETGYDILVITEKKGKRMPREDRTYYRLERNKGSRMGLAFRLHKLTFSDEQATAYDCNIATGHCDCIGCEQHRTCKHLDALNSLIEAGELS